MIEIADIEAARARIAGHVRRTPVLPLSQLKTPLPVEGPVTLKLESLQVTGSFKARGAMNCYLGAPGEETERGLATASGGNHGLAVARTAYAAGVPATVFVPAGVSPAKVDKMRGWNARVEFAGNEWSEANLVAMEFAEREGMAFIYSFADPLVIAGQGTLGLEVLQDMPELDAIVIAIGGGGLISGMSTAIRAIRPGVRIIGVEPEGSPTLKACLDAGRLVELAEVTTIVATMACRQTVEQVFRMVPSKVDDIVLVSDDEMADAARWLWFELGLAADLSGAASLAALRRYGDALANAGHVCALVCGAGSEGATQPG